MRHLVADALDPVEHPLEEAVLAASAGAGGRLAHASSSRAGERRGVPAEELGLGEHGLLELVEQHALVRRVDVGVPVRRPEQEHLGLGHGLLQRVHERDRAAGEANVTVSPPHALASASRAAS